MNRAVIGTAILLLAASGAYAQSSPSSPETRPPGPGGRGAEIRIERPDMSIFVRCGDGETAKSCADTATQLMEKATAMPASEYRGGRGAPDRDERRYRDRD